MENKKISVTQIIRHIIQLISFIIFPGLFILLLSSIETIIKTLIGGDITFETIKFPILVLLSVVPITILWGRFFCGYICAFGSMQELVNYMARKLKIKQINIKRETNSFLKMCKYVVLLLLILLWLFNISFGNYSPWNVFGIYSSYKGWTDLSSWISIGGLLLFMIIIASLFIERIFCKYFCPLGGIFSIISKPRLYKIKKNSKCVNCNLCSKKCPMEIDVNRQTSEFGKVKSGECIDCFKCIDTCNPQALYTNPKEAISGTVASIAISGIYLVGTIPTDTNISGISNTVITQGKYTDGTYEGSGQGYRGTTKVQVKVSNGNISSITIESYKDDDQFFNKAKSTIINEIISTQSTDVQTVSGATYSSRGIIEAVANALGITNQTTNNTNTNSNSNISSSNKSKSSINENTNTNTENKTNSNNIDTNTTNDISTNSSSNAKTDFSQLEDGTYSGTGQGRNGSIKVSVVVKNGKVTSITIESSSEDAQYFNRAKSTVINEIISEQSIDVQTVSGATMSSNGIIDAVANALGISYTNPNSQMQNGHGSKGNRMH